mmetsp:Transcript_52448/g.121961  ORF Transcript_52448/g.121961 Transcript_52448/m.121961 type:complete len:200 (+) Transcript_52448:276-875(+)
MCRILWFRHRPQPLHSHKSKRTRTTRTSGAASPLHRVRHRWSGLPASLRRKHSWMRKRTRSLTQRSTLGLQTKAKGRASKAEHGLPNAALSQSHHHRQGNSSCRARASHRWLRCGRRSGPGWRQRGGQWSLAGGVIQHSRTTCLRVSSAGPEKRIEWTTLTPKGWWWTTCSASRWWRQKQPEQRSGGVAKGARLSRASR